MWNEYETGSRGHIASVELSLGSIAGQPRDAENFDWITSVWTCRKENIAHKRSPHSNYSVLNRVTANFCGKSHLQCVILQSAPWEMPERSPYRRCGSARLLVVLVSRCHRTTGFKSGTPRDQCITEHEPEPGIDPALHGQFVFSARWRCRHD